MIKMNTKVVLKAGFLVLITFICNTVVGAENDFNVVPKLYEEVGCTDSAGLKRYKKNKTNEIKMKKCGESIGSTYDMIGAIV